MRWRMAVASDVLGEIYHGARVYSGMARDREEKLSGKDERQERTVSKRREK